jgi:type II secretory pathway pseudopilin PulG
MKRTAILVAISLVGGLAGCVSPAQVEAQDDAQCASLGVPQGTQGYADCRLRLAQLHQSEEQTRRLRMMALGQALQNAGQAMQQASPPPVHTTCRRTLSDQVDCTTS